VPDKWFGWLLIHYAASDVALFGAKPQYCTINLLGPPATSSKVFFNVMDQVCRAAEEIGIRIVTGHTGTYRGLSTMTGVCTAYGTVEKKHLITPKDAVEGDIIVCTKNLGLEIAINLSFANESMAHNLFGARGTRELRKSVETQSCVEDALILGRTKGVHAMHDATEGGLTAALNEMADASEVGFRIEFDTLPFAEEAHILRKRFLLSETEMLSMSSTGTVLAAVSPDSKETILGKMRQNDTRMSVLGLFTKDKRRIIVKKGKEKRFPGKEKDPYERILSEKQL
jgi:hydrogenase maturation factor